MTIQEDERIEKTLNIAWRYGQIDGSLHKMWVIDQMVRALCEDKQKYIEWVKDYETSIGLNEYYKWDTGIAP